MCSDPDKIADIQRVARMLNSNQLSLQDKIGALNCMHDQQAIITAEAVYAIDRAAFNQGKNAKYNFSIDRGGKAQTIVARGPGAVMVKN